MRKIIIGSVFFISGVITSLSIIISAAFYATNITEWRGSKLWFAIFGAYDMEASQSLNLGLPFTIGLVLFTMGLIILLKEYFNKS